MEYRPSDTATLVRREVSRLLEASPAYASLPAEKQRPLAGDTVRVAVYLAEPEGIRANELAGGIVAVPDGGAAASIDFPEFVSGLIDGVFQAIVDSSIEQMQAYGDLINRVAKSVEQFASDATSDDSARAWLTRTYPDCFELDEKTRKVRLRPDVDCIRVLPRLRLLPGQRLLQKLAPDDIENNLVPAARRRIVANRQQLLVTMTLMGINRIVVTDGGIKSS